MPRSAPHHPPSPPNARRRVCTSPHHPMHPATGPRCHLLPPTTLPRLQTRDGGFVHPPTIPCTQQLTITSQPPPSLASKRETEGSCTLPPSPASSNRPLSQPPPQCHLPPPTTHPSLRNARRRVHAAVSIATLSPASLPRLQMRAGACAPPTTSGTSLGQPPHDVHPPHT